MLASFPYINGTGSVYCTPVSMNGRNNEARPTLHCVVFELCERTDRQTDRRLTNKKHLKNVGPIRHNESPHANSPDVASGTVARRLRIDVHDNANDDNDNA